MCMFNVHCPYQIELKPNTYSIQQLFTRFNWGRTVFILLRFSPSIPRPFFSYRLRKISMWKLCTHTHTIVTLQSSWFMHRSHTRLGMFTWKLLGNYSNEIIECVAIAVFFVPFCAARQRTAKNADENSKGEKKPQNHNKRSRHNIQWKAFNLIAN